MPCIVKRFLGQRRDTLKHIYIYVHTQIKDPVITSLKLCLPCIVKRFLGHEERYTK